MTRRPRGRRLGDRPVGERAFEYLHTIMTSMPAAVNGVEFDTRAWLARAVEAPGSVIEMVRIRDNDTGSFTFAPLVRFQTAEGRTVDFQSTLRSNPPSYSTGDDVTVLYDPARPSAAAVSGFFSIWFGTIIPAIIGAVFVAFGSGAWLAGRVLFSPRLAAQR